MMSQLARFAGPTHALLRIAAGLLFLPHGAQKLFGALGGMGGSGAAAAFPDLMWFAGVIEFFGGLFVALGLFTRPAAFLCSGQMLVAYFKAHAPQGGLPIQNHGELALLYCFVFLFLAAWGAGPWSVDAARRKPI
jgi:putative oxidoreductase